MNKLPENEIVVLDVAGTRARIAAAQLDTALEKLGFVLVGDHYERPIADMEDREKLITSLIGLHVLFVDSHDWSPAEVVDYLREQGKVHGTFRRITWLNPAEYSISDA
ncbi:MAG: hypothetical protein ACXWC4_03010 [Telluria sp.]